MRVEPHLCFRGDCQAAFRFYESVFGGRVETMMTWGDSPIAADVPAEWREKIVHATLRLPGGAALLGGDVPPDRFERPQGFFVLVSLPDAAAAERAFATLAENGRVGLPLQKTFWSPAFGVVTDRFGISWEITTG